MLAGSSPESPWAAPLSPVSLSVWQMTPAFEAGQQRQLIGDRFEADDVVARNGPGMQQNGCDR